jgi:hypothetical protein
MAPSTDSERDVHQISGTADNGDHRGRRIVVCCGDVRAVPWPQTVPPLAGTRWNAGWCTAVGPGTLDLIGD